jgi:tetratricopeptide (TPR) repeat protein
MKTTRLTLAATLLGASALAQGTCGGPLEENNFGRPIDFYNPQEKKQVEVVERFHFTRRVEQLTVGESGTLPDDLHYTLKHIPNHPRALNAMSRWHLANRNPAGSPLWEAECYFDRAIEFRPKDATIRLLYGIHFHKKKEFEQARLRYEDAVSVSPEYAEAHYNLGLLYFDLKQYDKAEAAALKAYSLGYPLPGLRNRLKRVGKWTAAK